jgi:hypothetical protein
VVKLVKSTIGARPLSGESSGKRTATQYSTVLPRLRRLRSLAFCLVIAQRGDYVRNQNDIRGNNCGDGRKRRVAWEARRQDKAARVDGTAKDAPFHMYFSDAKYDAIGTMPRETLKATSLNSTPVL